MPIVPAGSINLAALNVPNIYVQIQPPNTLLNGVPTNLIGIVGTATWGPVNSPVVIGSLQDLVTVFGTPQPVQYDMGTAVYAASLQGASNFKCVRVTDGSDVAAAGDLVDVTPVTPLIGATLTALYTGTVGNTVNATISLGSSYTSAVPTYRLSLYIDGGLPEIFDNIGGTGAAFWANLVNAVNFGQSTARGPSQLCVATTGNPSALAPAQTTVTLTGGTNGNTSVTSATLIGDDSTTPREGMYALRNSLISMLVLADADDDEQWTLQNAFGLEEACYVIGTIAAGYQDDIAGAALLLQDAGIDSYAFSLAMGDWIQINDPFNNLTRFISPQAFKAGILAVNLPSNSSLNKTMRGIVATQKSAERRSYSDADLSQIRISRMEVITNPIPAGNVFGCRLGVNTSSNALTQTDNYPRMVNFIGKTILNGMGGFIGLLQTPTVRSQARATIEAFLMSLFQLGMIGDVNRPGDPAAAFRVVLDETNNPSNRVALGYMQADVQVILFSVIQYFVINLNANQGSQIQILPPQVGG